MANERIPIRSGVSLAPKANETWQRDVSISKAVEFSARPAAEKKKTFDARAQQALLADELKLPGDPSKEIPADPAALSKTIASPPSNLISPLVKSIVALSIVALLGLMPTMRLLSTTSAEAIINARVITLRAPIEGPVVSVASLLQVGEEYKAGQPILRISNPRSDHSKLDAITRNTESLQIERTSIETRLVDLRDKIIALKALDAEFQLARVAELETQVAETNAAIQGAQTKVLESQSQLSRSQKLGESGFATIANMQTADSNHHVENYSLDGLQSHLKGLQVELNSARRGISISDSHNDRSSSAERAEALEIQMADLKAQLAEKDAKIAQQKTSLIQELTRYNDSAVATIDAPVRGRLWEVLTSPGETVRQGQDLVRLLDCGGAVVTASVSEAAYNDLYLGGSVQFKLRGENTLHKGTVIALSGLAAVPSNFAIKPSRLEREPYAATLSVPDLSNSDSCDIGRTGVVTFDAADTKSLGNKLATWFKLILP